MNVRFTTFCQFIHCLMKTILLSKRDEKLKSASRKGRTSPCLNNYICPLPFKPKSSEYHAAGEFTHLELHDNDLNFILNLILYQHQSGFF